jgi:hypothetical protein
MSQKRFEVSKNIVVSSFAIVTYQQFVSILRTYLITKIYHMRVCV